MSIKLTLSIVIAALALAHGANILDIFGWDDKSLIEVPSPRGDQPNRNCLCKGSACVCCVDFNITFVDLGGPGCVHMKYLSPEEGFSVNVSYGKNLLHSSKIKGTNPAPICLEIFGKFAQVCAKFNDLAPTSDGIRGCLELEPKILGDTPLIFPIGCFKSTAGGMEMEDPPAKPEQSEVTTEADNSEEVEDEEDDDDKEEENDDSNSFDAGSFLMEAYTTLVNNFLDIQSLFNSTRPTNPEPTTTVVNSGQTWPEEPSSTEASQRSAKSLKHPNQL